ncbi:MAG TPA: hypothetical protein PKA20_11165 [Burkholderiaceae bacterium]|nr:hypothetical protein [Burkholderiaceae bacterium]
MNNRGLNTLDGRRVSYQTLLAERGERYVKESDPARFPELAAQAEAALDDLATAVRKARPDVIVVIGDDQGELYDADGMPALSIFTGEELVMKDRGKTQLSKVPMVTANYWAGYRMDLPHRYPGAPRLARQLATGLIERDVDVAITSRVRQPERYAFGHAYGFVIARLLKDVDTPMLPILVNTYFPPNTPTAARCHAIGRKIAQTLEAVPGDTRIAVVASGGLSHFLCEEAFDRDVFAALKIHDVQSLITLPEHSLLEGTSEIKNWIMMSAATGHLNFSYGEYIPVYRTPVGTGIGLGFAVWS